MKKIVRAAIAIALLVCLGAARAQAQPAQVGLLGTLDAEQYAPLVGALTRVLHDAVALKGRPFAVESRYAEGRTDRLPRLARELVETRPDVIVAWGDLAIKAAKEATATVPLVMIACDAHASGLVDSLARPSGNLTGVNCMSAEIATKRLDIIKDMRPGLSRVGILWNPGDPSKALELSESRRAARELGVALQPEEVRDVDAIRRAFSRLTNVEALIVLGDPLTFSQRSLVAELAAASRLPAVYAFRECVEAGGLASYGPNKRHMFELAGRFAARILAGATPSQLPIEQPTQFDLAINLRAAEMLGLPVPRTLLLQADHVIQ